MALLKFNVNVFKASKDFIIQFRMRHMSRSYFCISHFLLLGQELYEKYTQSVGELITHHVQW